MAVSFIGGGNRRKPHIPTDPGAEENILSNLKRFSPNLSARSSSANMQLQPYRSAPEMPTIEISVEGFDKRLLDVSPIEASGPDEISPRIL